MGFENPYTPTGDIPRPSPTALERRMIPGSLRVNASITYRRTLLRRGNPRGINSAARERTRKTAWRERYAQDHCVSPARLAGQPGTPLQGGGRWFETTSAHHAVAVPRVWHRDSLFEHGRVTRMLGDGGGETCGVIRERGGAPPLL